MFLDGIADIVKNICSSKCGDLFYLTATKTNQYQQDYYIKNDVHKFFLKCQMPKDNLIKNNLIVVYKSKKVVYLKYLEHLK